MKLVVIITFLLVLAAATLTSEALCTNAHFPKSQDIGTCPGVGLKGEACIHGLHLRYKAWANTGGMQGYSGETKSPKGAAYHAIYELFNQHPPCSCPSQVVAFGSCNLTIAGCWYFPTADDVPNKHVVVKVTATDPTTGLSGSYCCSENNATALQDAAKSAIADLAKKENLAKCLFNQHTLNTAVLSLKKRIDETVVSLGQVDRSIARY